MPTFFTRFSLPPRKDYHSDLPSLVVPEFAFECDINNLVKTRVEKSGRQTAYYTGLVSSLPADTSTAKYGDFTSYTSDKLAESLNIVSTARSQFESLPSHIRDRFSNDPVKLVAFVDNPSNYDEAVKLGLAKPKPNAANFETSNKLSDISVVNSDVAMKDT